MSNTYSIDITDKIISVRFSCEPKISDILEAIDEIATIDENGLRLWDMSKGLNLTNDEVKEIAEYAKISLKTPGKTVLVSPQDHTFGISRIHDVYRDQDGHDSMVFRTEQEAIAWLKKTM